MTFLSLFTPINILEEKQKFFASSSYNPIFSYHRSEEEYEEYISKHPSKKDFADGLLSEDSTKITEAAKKYFQTEIELDSINEAKSIVSNGYTLFNTSGSEATILFEAMRSDLTDLGIDYKIKIIDKHGFNVRPDHKNKILFISKYAELGLLPLDASVKHEMTHIIRYVNKLHNNSLRSKNHLPTEEGIASYMGDYHSKDGENSKFHHAAEYLATDIGLKGSLRDIYNYFIDLKYPEEFSWQRAIRHKFGFSDTSMPGDIMKPGMYFFYENKIKALNNNDILKLLSGKISLLDLKNVTEYSGIIPKDKLVKYFDLQV